MMVFWICLCYIYRRPLGCGLVLLTAAACFGSSHDRRLTASSVAQTGSSSSSQGAIDAVAVRALRQYKQATGTSNAVSFVDGSRLVDHSVEDWPNFWDALQKNSSMMKHSSSRFFLRLEDFLPRLRRPWLWAFFSLHKTLVFSCSIEAMRKEVHVKKKYR